jgi:hypothetical protein
LSKGWSVLFQIGNPRSTDVGEEEQRIMQTCGNFDQDGKEQQYFICGENSFNIEGMMRMILLMIRHDKKSGESK